MTHDHLNGVPDELKTGPLPQCEVGVQNSKAVGNTDGQPCRSDNNVKHVVRRASLKPYIPEWLREEICSKRSIKSRREAIEEAIELDDGFLAWALLALYEQQTPDEKAALKPLWPNRRGFSGWEGNLFMCVAGSLIKHGYLTISELSFLRRINPKGRSRLGKHGGQLIALIASASCPDRMQRKFKQLSDTDTLRERTA